MQPTRSERAIVFLVGAVQFVNVLDFMMVMPLGPDFAKALGIPVSHLGYLGGSYTAAAAVSGLVASFFLDRFDRRKALGVSMLGLVLGTLAGGFAEGLSSLLAARIVAGLFGGPAAALSIAIIADVVPLERRGRAMGAVMGSFAIASVLGVPAGLELARQGGWRLPFFAVAGLGAVVAASAVFLLPPMRGHLAPTSGAEPRYLDLLGRPTVLLSYLMTGVLMMSGFVLIPNIAAYLQGNLGYPRADLGQLYLAGGALSYVSMRIAGPLVDRFGALQVGLVGTASLLLVLFLGFVSYNPAIPVIVIFAGFMFSMGVRGVSFSTLTSKVPSPAERARYMSLLSAVQHMAAALGAFLSARILTELPDHTLVGIPRVATVAIALSLAYPALLWVVETRMRSESRPLEGNFQVQTPP